MTEAHACEQLAQGCYLKAERSRFELATYYYYNHHHHHHHHYYYYIASELGRTRVVDGADVVVGAALAARVSVVEVALHRRQKVLQFF